MTEPNVAAETASSAAPSAALPALTQPGSRNRFWSGVWQAGVLTIIMLTSLAGYITVLKWRGPDARIVTHMAWDDLIPFQPAWVWVYLIPYLIGPVAIGLLRRSTFRWYVTRGVVLVGLTLLIFIAIPTRTAPRPHSNLGDGPTARLYHMMVEVDEPPANAAPSLHVSLTFLLALALMRDFPRCWWIIGVGVGLVWLATLFTRQHHLVDVGTGVLLASSIVAIWALACQTWRPSSSR